MFYQNENRLSKREKYFLHNNLVSVVKGLEGRYTTIDLRNESCVTGKIKHVDAFMNVELTDAVLYDSRGSEHPFEAFYIRARVIRYVHIPTDKPVTEIIENQLKILSTQPLPRKRTGFKILRAERYQKEILEGIHIS